MFRFVLDSRQSVAYLRVSSRLFVHRIFRPAERQERVPYQPASAWPTNSGLSSWTKCISGIVTSVWLGHDRQYSRVLPCMNTPGSALINSFGIGLVASHSE
jgi:hypothetical protein